MPASSDSPFPSPWKQPGPKKKRPQQGKSQHRSSSRQSHPFLAQDPKAVVGQFHDLIVENLSDYGVYLSFGRDRVLLPNKYVPEGADVGQKIRVFIHTDSEDRPVATTLTPAGVVGDIVGLKVRDTAAFGVFMDWGLEKDLLVPRGEQESRMEPGETHLVKICLDKSSHRVYGSTLMKGFCDAETQDLAAGDAVDLIIHSSSPMGYIAVVNRACTGLLYQDRGLPGSGRWRQMPGICITDPGGRQNRSDPETARLCLSGGIGPKNPGPA